MRTPISRRGAAAWRIAAMEARREAEADPGLAPGSAPPASGASSMRTPERLEHVGAADRCPRPRGCRAWRPGSPRPAATSAAAVEMLNVARRRRRCRRCRPPARRPARAPSRARMARAAPTSSSTVSPFMRSATSSAPICAGVASPVHQAQHDRCTCRPRRDSGLPTACWIASWMFMVAESAERPQRPARLREEVLQQLLAFERQDRLGMELHALDADARGAARP